MTHRLRKGSAFGHCWNTAIVGFTLLLAFEHIMIRYAILLISLDKLSQVTPALGTAYSAPVFKTLLRLGTNPGLDKPMMSSEKASIHSIIQRPFGHIHRQGIFVSTSWGRSKRSYIWPAASFRLLLL